MRKDYRTEKRKWVIVGFLLAVSVLFIVRLYNLQIDDEKFKNSADTNAFLRRTIYPARGLIYGRGGELLVYNKPTYDVMVIPKDIQQFDTVSLCRTLGITPGQLAERFEAMKNPRSNPGYSAYTPQKLLSHLSAEDYGRLQEKLYLYPGFYIQKRVLREYNTTTGANVLGNIREVSQREMENDGYYERGDYCGDLGVEKSYETYLRGEKGTEVLIRDVHGRIQGRYEDGANDVAPVSGRNIRLAIDMELQQYAESLMVNKIGAVVALEPATGEILCMVSTPSYDPNLLVGRQRGENYRKLSEDPLKPLFDRALMGAYPPGSTFKPGQGLILLQEGIININTMYPCVHGFISGGLRVGCHSHGAPLSLKPALRTSCNAFFCWGFKNMVDNRRSKYGSAAEAFEVWKCHLVSLGYGYKLGVDLPGEGRGFLPNSEYYNKVYGQNRWSANTVISVAIGQGEVLATPLQIANLGASIANGGWFITPHVVKEIQDTVLPASLTEKRYPTINPEYFAEVAEGMRMAVEGGTCRQANLPDIEVCGKTGTAQNPHGRDHSAFLGFAPYKDPKIVVCVYVENAGFGARFGVPIGSLVMEKYLKGVISPERKYIEEQMLASNTIVNSGVKKH